MEPETVTEKEERTEAKIAIRKRKKETETEAVAPPKRMVEKGPMVEKDPAEERDRMVEKDPTVEKGRMAEKDRMAAIAPIQTMVSAPIVRKEPKADRPNHEANDLKGMATTSHPVRATNAVDATNVATAQETIIGAHSLLATAETAKTTRTADAPKSHPLRKGLRTMKSPLRRKMKALLRNSSLLLLTAWLTTACIEHTVYHSYQSIPAKGWGKRDTLLFRIPIADSLKTLRLTAEVRNKDEYAYQDFYLIVSHNLQDSTVFQTDTLKFILADKDGKWQGTGWGSLFQSALPLETAVARYAGNYTFKVAQGMKDETLMGITDVGIKIEK